MGDPSFPIKVAIECGIGICTKVRRRPACSCGAPASRTRRRRCRPGVRVGEVHQALQPAWAWRWVSATLLPVPDCRQAARQQTRLPLLTARLPRPPSSCGTPRAPQLTAEKTKREDNFMSEIDFVTANVIMALIADFMLTWIPAPTLSYS